MHTIFLLEKLEASTPEAKRYLDSIKTALKRARKNDDREYERECLYKISGSVSMLCSIGFISERERQQLYVYYTL